MQNGIFTQFYLSMKNNKTFPRYYVKLTKNNLYCHGMDSHRCVGQSCTHGVYTAMVWVTLMGSRELAVLEFIRDHDRVSRVPGWRGWCAGPAA